VILTAKVGVLANALALVAAFAPKNKMGTVLVTAAAHTVTLTRTSQNMTIAVKSATVVLGHGEIALDGDRLSALIAGFSKAAALDISTDGSRVLIADGARGYRLPTISGADLPTTIALDGEIGRLEIGGADLLRLLEPLEATDSDTARFYLGGVFWHTVDTTLTAVATNGRCLIRTVIPAGEFSSGRDLVVPAAAVGVLRKLERIARPASVTLRRSRTLLAVECCDFEFVTRLIDVVYPAYETVIPPSSANAVVCNRMELVDALTRLIAVATSTAPLLALSWGKGGSLNLYLARQPDAGADIIGGGASGAARFAAPIDQVAAMLGELRGKDIRLEHSEGRPLVMKGESTDQKMALVMPAAWNFDASPPRGQ
jgi:DNA polymerase III sliding clamp (beta) subunit (PCNA family)